MATQRAGGEDTSLLDYLAHGEKQVRHSGCNDGSRILYQDNELYSMLPDGTDARKVSSMDLSTDVAGYVYIVHWLPPA